MNRRQFFKTSFGGGLGVAAGTRACVGCAVIPRSFVPSSELALSLFSPVSIYLYRNLQTSARFTVHLNKYLLLNA